MFDINHDGEIDAFEKATTFETLMGIMGSWGNWNRKKTTKFELYRIFFKQFRID